MFVSAQKFIFTINKETKFYEQLCKCPIKCFVVETQCFLFLTWLFAKSKTQLIRNINHIEKWCNTWHMEINVTKSAFMRIENTPIQEKTKVKLFDEIVPKN